MSILRMAIALSVWREETMILAARLEQWEAEQRGKARQGQLERIG